VVLLATSSSKHLPRGGVGINAIGRRATRDPSAPTQDNVLPFHLEILKKKRGSLSTTWFVLESR